jgi:hypothetical protein
LLVIIVAAYGTFAWSEAAEKRRKEKEAERKKLEGEALLQRQKEGEEADPARQLSFSTLSRQAEKGKGAC